MLLGGRHRQEAYKASERGVSSADTEKAVAGGGDGGREDSRAIVREWREATKVRSLSHDKNAHGCTKMLALRAQFTYHTSRQIVPGAWVQLEPLKASEAALAGNPRYPPPMRRKLMTSFIIVHFQGDVCTFFCVMHPAYLLPRLEWMLFGEVGSLFRA